MKTTLAAAAIAAALGTAMFAGGTAQAQRYYPNGGWDDTCWNASVDRGTLYATCEDGRGRGRETSIQLRGCDRVENDNGNLYCASYDRGRDRRDRRDRYSDRLPGGGWDDTCRNGQVVNGTLYAQCRTGRGNYRDATLDLRGCNDVENDNGRLHCDR